jgi:hypothetical protein
MLREPELKSMAEEQLSEFKKLFEEVEQKLQIALLPKDEADDHSVIMEIRAGVGGEESALFAFDLFQQYKSYALRHGWKIEIIEERKEDSRAVRELFELLPEKEQIENRKNELEKLLKEHSVEMLKADIEYTKNKAKTDFWAYFLKSIKSGHYSSAELEKKKIAEEKKKLRAELEEKEKKEQEKTNEEKEKIAIEKYKKMTTEEIEKYKKEFDKISENIKKIAFQNSLEVFVVSKLKME